MLRSPGRARRFILAASLLAALVGVALPRPAEANLIGDPTLTSGAGRFGFGAELDFVLDRDIELDPGGDVNLDTNRFFVSGSYGFLQSLDGFVKLGLFNGEREDVDVDTGLGFGVGARGSFFQRGPWRFGGLFQVLYFTSELDTGPDIDWIEADLAGAVSYRGLGQVVPYGGIKLGLVDGEIDPGPDFEQDNLIGLFGGASVALTPQISVGAELRILDETALGFYGRFAF